MNFISYRTHRDQMRPPLPRLRPKIHSVGGPPSKQAKGQAHLSEPPLARLARRSHLFPAFHLLNTQKTLVSEMHREGLVYFFFAYIFRPVIVEMIVHDADIAFQQDSRSFVVTSVNIKNVESYDRDSYKLMDFPHKVITLLPISNTQKERQKCIIDGI